jgi:membrane associated rhomboid family serine protease
MTEFRPSRFEVLPVVIKNLLIVNVLFFLAQKTIGAGGMFDMVDLLALHHVKSPLFQPWQIVTHMFLHGDFWHLFGNMFALWMFGAILENVWGPKRFLTFYFLCGIGAALIHLTFLWYDYHGLLNEFLTLKLNPTPERILAFYKTYGLGHDPTGRGTSLLNNYLAYPDNTEYVQQVVNYISDKTYLAVSNATLGASGAVFGVLAAFVYLFPNTYIYLYFFVPVKAKWMGLVYFGIELFSAIQNSAGDNVARWAHIGGGLVGFLLVITWNKKNRRNFF